jgi:hypothetical protein
MIKLFIHIIRLKLKKTHNKIELIRNLIIRQVNIEKTIEIL